MFQIVPSVFVNKLQAAVPNKKPYAYVRTVEETINRRFTDPPVWLAPKDRVSFLKTIDKKRTKQTNKQTNRPKTNQ